MNRRPHLDLVAGFGLTFLLLTLPASAAHLSFDPPAAEFAGPSTRTVQVVVDQIDDLLGASLTIVYDPAVVSPSDVVAGEVIAGASCSYFLDTDTATPGQIRMDVAFFGCTATGSGSMVAVTFTGVAAGTSPLELAAVDLRDSLNEPIAFSTEPGSLTYLPEISANLAFDPETLFLDQTGQGQVCLTLAEVADFLGMSVSIGFDPAVIAPVAVTAGPALVAFGCDYYLDWVNADDFTDSIQIDLALLGCHGPADGAMVCLSLEGVAMGESPLTWLAVDIRDSDNLPVLVDTTPGTVVFDDAIATIPTSLSTIKARFRD